jgi:hypothetical protein
MKVMVFPLSERHQPKARFSTRLPNGDFLSFAVWPGKSDPAAEVITIQVRQLKGELWETVGRLAVYRSSDGRYSQLPERGPTQAKQEDINQ